MEMFPPSGTCSTRIIRPRGQGQCPAGAGSRLPLGLACTLAGNIHAWNVRPRLYLETVSEQSLPVKYRPWIGTIHPTALPAPALVGITDTNALASRACNAARTSVPENLFT